MTAQPTRLRSTGTWRAAVAALALVLAMSGCIQSGRTSHPDNFEGKVSCPVDPDPSITTKARIAWQAIPNGDLVVKDLELLEACMPNAKIQWSKMNSGGDAIQAFGSNSVDISLIGSSPAVKAASPPLSKDIRIIWISDVIGKAESLVAKDPKVKTLEDLKGKTIAVPFGSTAHFSLLTLVKKAGLNGKIQIINLAPDAILAAWQRDEIDATWVWEPTLSQVMKNGHLVLSAEDSAAAGAPTFDLIAGTNDFVKKNPDFMRMWTAAENEGTRIMRDDPDKAAVSIAVQLGVSKDDALKLTKGFSFPTAKQQASKKYFGGQLGTALKKTAVFLDQQSEIDSVADDKVYQDMPYSDSIKEIAK